LLSVTLLALADLRLLLLLFLLRVRILRFDPRRAVGGASVGALGTGVIDGWLCGCCVEEVLDGMLTADDLGFSSAMVSLVCGGDVVAGPGASSEVVGAPVAD
jgi:hypothetical protein